MTIETIKDFIYGLIDTIEDTSIPDGAASKSLNWETKGTKIELRRGYGILGNELTTGKITGLHVAKKSGGTEVIFRTRGIILEYYVASTLTWTEIGTNVLGTAANGKDISFAEYHSLAGDQLFVSSPYGPLLKIMLANPGSYTDMYSATVNYKGYIKIKQNRMWAWGMLTDRSSPYMSHIDEQNFTTVTAESIGAGGSLTYSGTLAFKAAGATRTCFAITFTDGTETFTDNNDGTLTGSAGGTGTINYTSGAFSITFNAVAGGAVTSTYQWEDSNNGGVTDFRYSATRVAGEGNVLRQDDGGILQNIFSLGDEEYCVHETKTWVIKIGVDDTTATNLIWRNNVGMPSRMSGADTGEGIYYINNYDNKDPQLNEITLSVVTGVIENVQISKRFKYKTTMAGTDLSGYSFNKSAVIEWGDYILTICRTSDSTENNRMIVYNKKQRSVDIFDYYASCLAIYGGTLIAGDTLLNNVYTLFSGFDDDDSKITNYWEGNSKDHDKTGQKETKRLIIQGEIDPDQSLKVSLSADNGTFIEVETIEGNGSYVDRGQAVGVGSVTIGSKEVGGGGSGVSAYNYEKEIDLGSLFGRYENVKVRFEATGIGYVSVSTIKFFDIRHKTQKVLLKHR